MNPGRWYAVDQGTDAVRSSPGTRHQLTPKEATKVTDVHGAQVMDIIERFTFNLGSAIDCISRAGRKPGSAPVADLERAQWFLEREIERIKQDGEEIASSSQSSAVRPASLVNQLGENQQNGATWQDRMGDRFRFNGGEWEYQTAGQSAWEPVRFKETLTDFGPYSQVLDS
jgi:hypothetical protein